MTSRQQKQSKKNSGVTLIYYALSAVLWFAVWLAGAAAVGSELILPNPASVLSALCALGTTWIFWRSILISLVRVAAGIILGVAAAVPHAVLCRRSRLASALSTPALTVIRATPVASFILLAFFWLGVGFIPVFISFLMVLPIMWGGAVTGLDAVPAELEEMTAVFSVPRGRRIRDLYIPAALPALRASAVTSVGLAWKAGIAAEVLCTPKTSIGRGMYEAKIYLETPTLFAWTAAVIILSLIIERSVSRVLAVKPGVNRGTNRAVKNAAGDR